MTSRPILFSAPMVRALLDGTKTQTRRKIALDGDLKFINYQHTDDWQVRKNGLIEGQIICPYGKIGDELWVRETWQAFRRTSHEYDEWEVMRSPKDRHDYEFSPVYRADEKIFPDRWLPAIHMPREFSRITLEITGVKVERLQNISEEDAKAEGAEPVLVPPDGGSRPFTQGFMELWERINGPESWAANPWVFAISFKRVTP